MIDNVDCGKMRLHCSCYILRLQREEIIFVPSSPPGTFKAVCTLPEGASQVAQW